MNNLENDDTKLNNLNNEIIRLNNIIEELEESKNLKKILIEKKELENKIIKLSTYDINLISNIIKDLLESYEKIEYQTSKDLFDENIYITPINPQIHPSYGIKINKNNQCVLYPSFFKNNEKNKIAYIQNFLDYLYYIRSSNNLFNIDYEIIKKILNDYIKLTEYDQLIRKGEIKKKKIELKQKKKQEEFEKSCLIDRNLIFNSIVYIINNYEENIHASQIIEEKKDYTCETVILYGIHKLVINYKNYEMEYSTIIDKDKCYLDEEYCGMYVNTNKNTNICFFEIKNTFSKIINESLYFKKFMEMIEHHFYKNNIINISDIEMYMIELSNIKKEEKRRILTI